MKKNLSWRPFCIFVLLVSPVLACQSQDVHPQKAVYKDAESWPATKPGDVELKNFKPFRAVYKRNYTNKEGQPRTDRVIITAEEIGWDGQPAIAISVIDTGDAAFEDTNGRSLSMYVDQNDLSVLFEVGPIPGTAKDYYVVRQLEDRLVMNNVSTETGKHQSRTMDAGAPGFGPGSWVIANMNLKEGMKIRLDPVYSPRANALTGFTHIGHVAGQESYTDLAGNTYEAWMIEHTSNLSSASISRRPMIDRPPYLLGSESLNWDTGEKKQSLQLMSFQYLDD